MQVIWAKGQEFGQESHTPASGLENCEAKDYLFYRRDEIKYHGSHNSQRGFVPELDFYGEYSFTGFWLLGLKASLILYLFIGKCMQKALFIYFISNSVPTSFDFSTLVTRLSNIEKNIY